MNEVESPRPARLHRPWRALIAATEVVLAGLAVWPAFVFWGLGVKMLTVTLSDGTVLTSTRYIGSWMTGAIGLGTVAAILLVDAVREVLLAMRIKPRRREPEGSEGYAEGYLPDLNGG